jgi:hypothetical protein
MAAGVSIEADDLAQVVDVECSGEASGQGIVEGDVGAAAVEKAVKGAGARIPTDDLAEVVNAPCLAGAGGGQGIVDGGVGID